MKKFLSIMTVCLCGIALAACQQSGPDGGGVVVKQEVSVTIKPAGTMSNFTAYNENDFSATQKVQLRCLLYDPSGKRVKDDSATLNDFSGEKTLSYTLSGNESYTLVALAYYGGSSPAYTVSDTESLSSLTVKQTTEHKSSDMNAVLGYAVESISPSASSLTVPLQSATSLVYLEWKNIHAGKQQGGTTYPLYGDYQATATDIWGKNTYTWTITVEKGASDTEVIIKNLCPYFAKEGWTADKGVNIFTGTYNATAKTITLPIQATGLSYGNGQYSISLVGGRLDGDLIYFEDLVFSVGNGTLTTTNIMGSLCTEDESEDAGWYELFDSGIVFNSKETPSGGQGGEPDRYLIIYHNNDIMRFNGRAPVFSTSLAEVNNNSSSLTPANYTGNSIYGLVFLFPGQFDIFGRAYTEGKTSVDSPMTKVNLMGNNQYVFSLECSNMSITYSKGTLNTKSDILIPSLKTWKMPSGVYAPRARGKQLEITPRP